MVGSAGEQPDLSLRNGVQKPSWPLAVVKWRLFIPANLNRSNHLTGSTGRVLTI